MSGYWARLLSARASRRTFGIRTVQAALASAAFISCGSNPGRGSGTYAGEETNLRIAVSGNEITDQVRRAGREGDGLAPEASIGIWEETTNLCLNGGFETNLDGWAAGSGWRAARTLAGKFGATALALRSDANVGENHYQTEVTVEAGQTYTFSAWVRIIEAFTSGAFLLRVDDDSQRQIAASNALKAPGDWQRLNVTFTPDVPKVRLQLYGVSFPNGAALVDGVQLEAKALATPYVETDGAAASRRAGRLRTWASLLDETEGWIAAHVRLGGSSSRPPPPPIATLVEWGENPGEQLLLSYQQGDWQLNFITKGTNQIAKAGDSFGSGDPITIVASWGVDEIGLSLDGARFNTGTRRLIPDLSATTFEIGSGQTSLRGPLNADILAFACGKRALADLHAKAIDSFFKTDRQSMRLNSLPGAPSLLWVPEREYAFAA